MRKVLLGVTLILIAVAVWAGPVWPPPVSRNNGFVYMVPVLAWNGRLQLSRAERPNCP